MNKQLGAGIYILVGNLKDQVFPKAIHKNRLKYVKYN